MMDEKDRRIEELQEKNDRLRKENEKRKRKEMNIKFSSKKETKPLGAPKGHEPYTRHIPERIDHIKPHIPKKCPDCGAKLKGKPKKKRSRHITEIKLTSRAETTRHDIYTKYCPQCKKYI